MFRVRVLGRENLPDGGAVLAGNHISYGDPVLLWCAMRRPLHFMAKSELWSNPLLAWATPRVWAFPVRRGRSDREAISNATELLTRGELVGIFPEGTRNTSGDATVQGGAAFIAMRAGVPIVPVGIAGTDAIRPRGTRMIRFPRVTMSLGQPVSAEEFAEAGRKERIEAMTAETMRRITVELERARRL
ncbi:MAG: lysophospholipid acyltransferase family protein [Actinomycetota bacterium]|nr:lysophospholipid acyltransferase family protein [Actinomycetota bacterium]